jgi:Flp pilus assembly protein TadD
LRTSNLGRADALERRGRLRAAEEQYVRVLELQPGSPMAASRLARVRAAIAEWMRVHEPR